MNQEQPLWKHQIETIAKALPLNHFALLCEAGTGKTRSMIEILREKFRENNRLLRTLVLCPQIVCENWKRELHLYSKITDKDVLVLKGQQRKRVQIFTSNQAYGKVFITNYESLQMKELYSFFEMYKFEVIIADESHRIKSHDSVRARQLLRLGPHAKYRYIMTGTPMTNNILDYYTQFKFLDGGQCFEPFGKNFFTFRNYYFYNKNASAPAHVTWPNWEMRKGAEVDLKNRVEKISYVAFKKDCLDLPPFIRKTINVELSKEQKQHYDEMKVNFITYINDKACIATLAITKALRLQQIVSGYIKLADDSIHPMEDNPRIDALKDLLTDLVLNGGHKVIVWACFKENYEQIKRLCEKIKIKFVECHGDISPNDKQESIRAFNDDSDIQVFIGNQGAAGLGVNLVSAAYAIYYSRNFSLEHDIQSEARNYRGGSERHQKITRYDLVAQGTIDEVVLSCLAAKSDIALNILKGFNAKI